MIFEKVATLYGQRNTNTADNQPVFRCPGDGVCDRFSGAGGNTFQERVENATPGCPQCQGRGPLPPRALIKAEGKVIEDILSDEEVDYALGFIENLIDEYHMGLIVKSDILSLDFYIYEGYKFWIKAERSFDRDVGNYITAFIKSFSKK